MFNDNDNLYVKYFDIDSELIDKLTKNHWDVFSWKCSKQRRTIYIDVSISESSSKTVKITIHSPEALLFKTYGKATFDRLSEEINVVEGNWEDEALDWGFVSLRKLFLCNLSGKSKFIYNN